MAKQLSNIYTGKWNFHLQNQVIAAYLVPQNLLLYETPVMWPKGVVQKKQTGMWHFSTCCFILCFKKSIMTIIFKWLRHFLLWYLVCNLQVMSIFYIDFLRVLFRWWSIHKVSHISKMNSLEFNVLFFRDVRLVLISEPDFTSWKQLYKYIKMNAFLLLMWKNWKLQSRKPLLTAFEIGFPVFFGLLLLLIRQIVDIEKFDSPREWNPFTIGQLPEV